MSIFSHHSAHAAHAAHATGHAAHSGGTTFGRCVNDHGFSGDHKGCNAGGVNESSAHDLGGIDNTSFLHVNVFTLGGIETSLKISSLDEFVDNNGAFESCVLADSLGRDTASMLDDTNSDVLVKVLALEVIKSLRGEEESRSTSWHDAFISGSAGCAESILNAVLKFTDFNFRSSTDLDNGDSSCESSCSFLEFLSIVFA